MASDNINPEPVRLSTSLRVRDLKSSLGHAKRIAPQLGITRVTDITRLDRIGIPVFTSIRPGAVPGSLCVNAGKGVHREEAEIGAYMEAIEFALAEPGRSGAEIVMATAREVLDGPTRPGAVLDFCPILDAKIRLDAPLACVVAEELLTGSQVLIPAELVFLPYVGHEGTGHFGSNSNGLASGNTPDEATLHALFEVIERDIRAHQTVRDTSTAIRLDSLPASPSRLTLAIAAAGLETFVRTQDSPFGLPYFLAAIHDPDAPSPIYVSGGYGCHLSSEVALVRAICEAAQSRLSYIHGGRDDLIETYERFEGQTPTDLLDQTSSLVEVLRETTGARKYTDITDLAHNAVSLTAALQFTLESLERNGIRHVCRVRLTTDRDPLQVVRVVVPRLEHFNQSSRRVGPRLREYARQLAG